MPTAPSTSLQVGDVVWVPFPFVEQARMRARPALIVSAHPGGSQLLWALMITSAANARWPGDVCLETNYLESGLPIASVIRTIKISAVEAVTARKIGVLPPERLAEVLAKVATHLGL